MQPCNLRSLGLKRGPYQIKVTLMLLEEFECPLLGDEAQLLEFLDRLEASAVLLTAHNAADLRLHEILLGEPTACVVGGAVKHLSLRADGGHSATVHSLAILASAAVLTSGGHFVFCLIPRKVEWRSGL